MMSYPPPQPRRKVGMPVPEKPTNQVGMPMPEKPTNQAVWNVRMPVPGDVTSKNIEPLGMPRPAIPTDPTSNDTGYDMPYPETGFQATPGYPLSQSPPGYPASSGTPGYPASSGTPGYPASSGTPGYPASSGTPGYPPSKITPGYAPSKRTPGYPPSTGTPGYPPSTGTPGYPPSTGTPGYPPSTGTPGYPPSTRTPGYPPSTGTPGYPPSTGTPGHPLASGASGYPLSKGIPGFPIPPSAGMTNLYIGEKQELSRSDKYATVKPVSPFNPEEDARKLYNALRVVDADEKTIINILAARTNQQRQCVALAFQKHYNKDLNNRIKNALMGNFLNLVLTLMTPPPFYDAEEVHRAIKKRNVDEDDLIEILCSRTNAELTEMKNAYRKKFDANLETEMMKDKPNGFMRLLSSLLTASRDEDKVVDKSRAEQDAKELYEAGEARWGKDDSKFIQIMCMRSHEHLLAVFLAYNDLSTKTIDEVIEGKMSGAVKKCYVTIAKIVRGKPAFFAQKLEKAMKGIGTLDKDLIRLVVTRCEVDMELIKEEFCRNYHKSLKQFIKNDTSGSYKSMLLALIGEK